MKKIVLTFGLISGAISSVLMMGTMRFINQIGFDRGVMVGYTAIVLSFLLVFFGIRSYRENVGDGYISFGRAFQVGILIALISSLIYIVTWEIVFQNWLYDFPEKYTNYLIEQERASGASAEQIARTREEWNSTWELYRGNILVRAAYTFLEPFPVGLLITLISAVILRKRRKQQPA
ncbi:MAG TPA: DUF4199 domain-containing protein [Pyrinomonadaceae bacterium]|nr:DUF4199 domain-containing protein [Pyrinomonadaceae bacterium]